MEAKIKLVADHAQISFDEANYYPALENCWNCHSNILVFNWKDKVIFDEVEPPLNGRPKTIKFMYSSTVGHAYWANTCPWCNKIQGDYYLFCEVDGPFGLLSDFADGERLNQESGKHGQAPSGSEAQEKKVRKLSKSASESAGAKDGLVKPKTRSIINSKRPVTVANSKRPPREGS
jgi:hypothetical protein